MFDNYMSISANFDEFSLKSLLSLALFHHLETAGELVYLLNFVPLFFPEESGGGVTAPLRLFISKELFYTALLLTNSVDLGISVGGERLNKVFFEECPFSWQLHHIWRELRVSVDDHLWSIPSD